MTEVFRFMDQRGVNKVTKKDFIMAVERMRISISRDDVSKVWGHIDSQGRGYIMLGDLFGAYGNRVNNFGKTIETLVEKQAVNSFNKQEPETIEALKSQTTPKIS